MIRLLSVAALIAVACVASGCSSTMAPFDKTLAMARGPEPEITGKVTTQSKMACVASRLTPNQRSVAFGVIAAPDKTGKANFAGNDATGSFNTQGAADMVTSSLGRTGVTIVELGPEYRAILDWSTIKAAQGYVGNGIMQKEISTVKDQNGESTQVTNEVPYIPIQKGTMFPVRYGVYGSISGLDFVPGGGVSAGAFGASAGYNQNRAQLRIDLRLVEMAIGNSIGGRVVATTTVKKQVVNDGVQVSLSRYFGSATPVLANFEAGAQRREALQDSTGDMLDLAVADLLEQVFMKKRSPCATLTIAAARY